MIDVPRQVIRTVKKRELRQVFQEVEVPGDIIEVIHKVPIDRKVHVPNYVNKQVPLIVAQTHHPKISETGREVIQVEVRKLNPKFIPVDVFIPKPVILPLIAKGRRDFHRLVDVPAAQHNSMIKKLNAHMLSCLEGQHALEELYIRDPISDTTSFLPEDEAIPLIHPM